MVFECVSGVRQNRPLASSKRILFFYLASKMFSFVSFFYVSVWGVEV